MDKSWCLSYREFPEVFKTPLTFYPTFNMKAVVANQNMKLWATSFALVGCSGSMRATFIEYPILKLLLCKLTNHI